MMNKKIYITCVLIVLYVSIYRFRPYFTQRYTPLITEASITITKNKQIYAEYDDGDKTYIIEEVDTIEVKDDEEEVVKAHQMSTEEIASSSDNSMYINNKEPYLNRFQRRFASSKERGNKGGYLFLRHMRKAGGTTLRVYFHDALLHHNITRSTDDFRSYKSLTKEQMEKRKTKTQKKDEVIVDSNHYQVHYIEHEFLPMDWKCPSIDPRWKESLRIIVLRHPIERHLSEYFFSGIPMHGKKATTAVEYFPIDKSKLYINKTYTDGMAKFLSEHLPNWLQGIGNRLSDNPKQRVEGNFDSIFSRHYTDNFQLRALAGCSSTNCLMRKNVTKEQIEKVVNFHPTIYNYSVNPVPRCTQYFRKEDKPSALFEQCAKYGHVAEECKIGCSGPCFYPSVAWGDVGDKDLHRAKVLLLQFDAVLLTEKLDDIDQADFLSDVMGVPRDSTFSLANKNITANTLVEKSDKREKTRFYRDLLMKLGLKDILSNLEEENKLEIEFFHYAEKLNEVMLDQWQWKTETGYK